MGNGEHSDLLAALRAGDGLPEPPASADPFSIFGLPARAATDSAALRRLFLDASRRSHPDRWARSDDETRRRARQWTTLINDAHRRLSTLEGRLEVLLEREGLGQQERDERRAEQAPPELLAEVFELQEALSDVGDGPPDDATRAALDEAVARLRAQRRAADEALEALAAAWDAGPDRRAETAGEVLANRAKARYLGRLCEQIATVLRRQ